MPKIHHIDMDIEIPDQVGAVPKVSIRCGTLKGTDLLFHLNNVAEHIRVGVAQANVMEALGLNLDGTPKVALAQPAHLPRMRP